MIDAKIDRIFYQFRRTFYIVFVLPILSMMVFTFFIGNGYAHIALTKPVA